jgi:hypothetical protein
MSVRLQLKRRLTNLRTLFFKPTLLQMSRLAQRRRLENPPFPKNVFEYEILTSMRSFSRASKFGMHTFLLAVSLLTCISNDASAQNELEIATTGGCKFQANGYGSSYEDFKIERSRWKGQCVNGYLEGAGILLSVIKSGAITLTAGVYIQGRFSGVGFQIYKTDHTYYGFIDRDSTNRSLNSNLKSFRDTSRSEGWSDRAIDLDIAFSRTGKSRSLTRDTVLELLELHIKRKTSPEKVFETTELAALKEIEGANSAARDDPKVLGRGGKPPE